MFESWLYTGLAGLVLGYAVLMISPGNYVRLIVTHDNGWFNQTKILENLHILAVVLLIQFILWYFYLRSLTQISNTLHAHLETEKIELKKELILLKALSITSMGMSACMLFSPDFHLRSAFPGTVQLIIVVAIVLRIQKEYGIKLLEQNAKRFLICASVIYFVMSAGFTLQHLYEHHIYNELLVSRVKELKENSSKEKTILIMEPFSEPVIAKDFLSGFHTFNIDISQDVNYWTNVAFARFYDIKGIRVRDDSKEDFVSGNGLK